MRLRPFDPIRLHSCLAAVAVLSTLAACGGGGSAAPSSAAAASAPSVITQSTITLPTSVQVVSAK
jgi:hypothetical protein